jgi:hypothetical protein
MGDKPRILNTVGHGGLSTISGHATISAHFAGTGRTVTADAVFGEIDAWSRVADPRSDIMLTRVQEALRLCQPVALPPMPGFRGRNQPSATGIPSREDMGPPPAHIAPDNRYNEAGMPALYLCNTRAAVGRELPSSPITWVQQFLVPFQELRIADLRSPEANADQILAAVMWNAELAGEEGQPSQQFSRLVASIVSEQFDGMLVSGVRGDAALLYSNLVIFNPGESWRSWLSPHPPTPL